MFGWFKPVCPVDVAAKDWIENRLEWLSDQFGRDTFTRRAVILPTKDFFPDPIDGTESSVRNVLDTDLTAVFHGFGIFLGHSPRNWDGQYSNWPGTDLKRPEYMTVPMFAYALAHTAWFRDQPKPDWLAYLSLDLRACFKQGIRYLMKTGDSTFFPESAC